MSEPVITVQAAPPTPHAAGGITPPLRLVRLPVDKSLAAVTFLRLRSRGVMDLIAHFWEGLGQTPPLQRTDLHLVVAGRIESCDAHIQMSKLDASAFSAAMLYVPKAHRADILAADPASAAALAAYICHQGLRQGQADISVSPDVTQGEQQPVEVGQIIPTLHLTDLTCKPPVGETIPAELPARTGGGNGTSSAATAPEGGANGSAGGSNGMPIDFLTGDAAGIGWMVPLLLPLVHKRTPARQLINVVMQLPPEVPAGPDPHVRPARESDIPLLNRWRRLYKEERGIHFDADMDALVSNQRVFVYDLASEGAAVAGQGGVAGEGSGVAASNVVAVAKIDLDLAELVEIGGVYTFAEYRQNGYGAALVSAMAHRIRQGGKAPTLQVDESNVPALRLYEKSGWRSMGKLARVWLTG